MSWAEEEVYRDGAALVNRIQVVAVGSGSDLSSPAKGLLREREVVTHSRDPVVGTLR